MSVIVYRSSDASAPALTGQQSSLIGVLDACLVNGYGAKPAAGWAKEFSAANLAVYRAPVASGTRFRLRVDDSGTTHARLSGYEDMSGVSAGTGQFPTNAQVSGGLYCRKSETTDATVRSWMLIATQRCFYFFPVSNVGDWLSPSGQSYQYCNGQFFFGDILTNKPGDQYNCVLIAATGTSSSSSSLGVTARSTSQNSVAGHYIARAFTQVGGSLLCGKVTLFDPTTFSGVMGDAGGQYPLYPDPITGGLLLSPVMVTEGYDQGSRIAFRGYMPGLYSPLHNYPGQHGDIIDGTGAFAGKQFMIVQTCYSTSNGRLVMEISDTW